MPEAPLPPEIRELFLSRLSQGIRMTKVVKTRTPHVCVLCGKSIKKGSTAWTWELSLAEEGRGGGAYYYACAEGLDRCHYRAAVRS